MKFKDRLDAGMELAKAVEKYRGKDVLVLAVPRGGVIVAGPVANSLKGELDLIIPRKVSLPGNRELAVAAVAPDGTVFYNEPVMKAFKLTPEELNGEVAIELKEINRRLQYYRGNRPLPDVKGRVVMVIDDGIATGLTVKAALKSIIKDKPERLILAVPVAPPETVKALGFLADEITCLIQPDPFYAVGQFYLDFNQITDGEVMAVLSQFTG